MLCSIVARCSGDVMWAVTTRSEPSEQVDIIRGGWSSSLDPRLTAEDREQGLTQNSKMIIDACKPFAWRDKYPKTTALSIAESRTIEDKWLTKLKAKAEN
jgi:3-polyprenyl-4-hydroxybenzoate decarboxylase